ncbi:MAG TPA: GNAT family N-acetyltransferase [Jatrophihabitantaceae bacterium]|jgi:GNAT superfamily N-acetyltransferase
MIEIRPAGPGDAITLGEIHAAAWEAAYGRFFEPAFVAASVQSRRTRWSERLARPNGTILLAALDGRPLALSWSRPSAARPGLAEIYSFYGHPDGWGTGIAGELMSETLRRLHDEGFAQVHLWTLRDTPQARRFYTKCGFAESGRTRPHDYGDGTPLVQVEYERAC